MFGTFDLPNGVRLRMTQPNDSRLERAIHDANRDDLLLIDGEEDFVQSIFDLQYRARDQGYGQQYPNASYFMIEKTGATVGRLVVDFGHNEVRIVDIALIPAMHGMGVGTTVVQAIMTVAAKMPNEVSLSVRNDNKGAAALYRKLGFVLDPHVPSTQMHTYLRWMPTRNDMVDGPAWPRA